MSHVVQIIESVKHRQIAIRIRVAGAALVPVRRVSIVTAERVESSSDAAGAAVLHLWPYAPTPAPTTTRVRTNQMGARIIVWPFTASSGSTLRRRIGRVPEVAARELSRCSITSSVVSSSRAIESICMFYLFINSTQHLHLAVAT